VSLSTKTQILSLPRLVLGSLTMKSKVTVCQGFTGTGNESWVCVDVDTPVTKEKVREAVVNELMISSNSTLLVRVKDNPLPYKRLD
jgi:hypothetical protein